MKFRLRCPICGETFTVRGHSEEDVNATVLSDRDSDWSDACEHVATGQVESEIIDSFYDDDDPYV